MCLLRKEYELTQIMLEYDKATIVEGILSGEEKRLHQERMRQLETSIAELRQEVEHLIKTITH